MRPWKPACSPDHSLRRTAIEPLPDWPQLYQELKKLGVTLQLRWVEYRAQHPTGYGHTPTALNGSRSQWFGACA